MKAIHLFNLVDSNILEAHYIHLLAASKDKSLQAVERKELCHRAIEVAAERFGDEGSSEQYIDAINDNLSSSVDGAVDDGALRLVLSCFRRGEHVPSDVSFPMS
jgi:hypothetical protein